MRVQGHALRYEGAPHDDRSQRIVIGRWPGVGGSGRALCECGAMSEVLSSAYQRRAWHSLHKADVPS